MLQLARRHDDLLVKFVTRGILTQATMVDAVAFTQWVDHASGQNYTIGGIWHVASLECLANKVVHYVLEGAMERVWHVNHP